MVMSREPIAQDGAAAQARPLLRIENLFVRYKTEDGVVNAVNGLDLELRAGDTLALVGETGAGKTTAALSVMRLLPQRTGKITDGKIYFNDIDLTTASSKQMRRIRGFDVSMIFQDPMSSLNPVLTVGNQIAETLLFHNKKMSRLEASAKADELLELVGIPSHRGSEYPHQFSGGMKQRIVIAIALSCEPKLMLADEPTTALDVTIQAQVLKLIKDLQEKLHMAMLLITHYLGVVAQTCDHVAIMYSGKVIESGASRDIFLGDRHHPYTEGLFGSLPVITKKTRRLNPIDGMMPDPSNLPSGCAFHPRCPHCKDICREKQPAVAIDGAHRVRCHLFGQPDAATEEVQA